MMTGLKRLALVALLAPALTGCPGAPESVDAGLRPFTASARFLPGNEVTVIEVTVNDRQPLRAAELVAPDGTAVAAESVDVKSAVAFQPPLSRQPLTGPDAAAALPLGGFGNFAPPGSQTVSAGQLHSTALIRLADPDSYARDWRLFQVRLRLGDPPHASTLSLPAPQPPAAL